MNNREHGNGNGNGNDHEHRKKDNLANTDEIGSETESTSLPQPVIDEAERLTRLCINATVDAEATAYHDERQSLLDEYGYAARVRDADDTLVLYPQSWLVDGIAQVDQIDDTDQAIEISLSGPATGADWEDVETTNQAIIDTVREEHGRIHAKNIRAFADFMGNHYLKPVTDATRDERREFLDDYYTRNAWPSEKEAAVVSESIRLLETIER
jgi:hypothetical protein